MRVSYFGKSPFPYILVLGSKDQFLARLHQQDAGLIVFLLNNLEYVSYFY